MHITKSKKILDLIEMKSRILVIIVGMYCYWYSVTIWNGDSCGLTAMSKSSGNGCHINSCTNQKTGVQMPVWYNYDKRINALYIKVSESLP